MTLLSIHLKAHKNAWGPLLGVLDFIPWTIISLESHLYVMVAFNAVVAAMEARAFILWRRADKNHRLT